MKRHSIENAGGMKKEKVWLKDSDSMGLATEIISLMSGITRN